MKVLLISLIVLMVSCGKSGVSDKNKGSNYCSSNIKALENLEVGQELRATDIVSSLVDRCLTDVSTYRSGSYCAVDYEFSKWNDDKWSFDYYYNVSTDCSELEIVKSVYRD